MHICIKMLKCIIHIQRSRLLMQKRIKSLLHFFALAEKCLEILEI